MSETEQAAGPGSGIVAFPGKPRVPLGQQVQAPATISFSDHGGPVIPHVRLILVFWGPWWNTTTAVPTVGQVTDAVVNILTGPYMYSLVQYRGIGSGYLQAGIVISEAVGTSPAAPPSNFSDGDVAALLENMVAAGLAPGPGSDPNLLYLVMMPQGVSRPGSLGEHTYVNYNGTNLHYGWVANSGSSLAAVTWVLSHELVESVTDPEGSAVTGTGCNQSGWCEIGDVCTANLAVINGVTVQRYWSQVDGECVVPTDPGIEKHDKDTKDTKEHKEHKEIKDIKDRKVEHKEILKEKELDRPPFAAAGAAPDRVQRIMQLADALAREAAGLAGQGTDPAAYGHAFIQAEERPAVGDQAVHDPYTPAPLY